MKSKELFIDKEFTDVPAPSKGDSYYDCVFHKLNGAVLQNCTLRGSKFVMDKAEDIIGLTVTMDCFSFEGVELSEEVFDFLLLLICKSKGNTEKRLKIINDVVGHDKAAFILKQFRRLQG